MKRAALAVLLSVSLIMGQSMAALAQDIKEEPQATTEVQHEVPVSDSRDGEKTEDTEKENEKSEETLESEEAIGSEEAMVSGETIKDNETTQDENSEPEEAPIRQEQQAPTLEAYCLADGKYRIRSGLGGNLVLDVAGGSDADGANVQLYTANDTEAQIWLVSTVDGKTEIRSLKSGKCLDLTWGGKTAGTNVWQYAGNGSDAQRWVLTGDASGVTLCSALDQGMVMDVAGARAGNGANVQIWSNNGSDAQKWIFEPVTTKRDELDELAAANASVLADGTYTIASAVNEGFVLDVYGASMENYGNVQLWEANGSRAQRFAVSHDEKGYVTFQNLNSGKALDVANGSSAKGTNIWQYSANGSYAQKWIVCETEKGYEIISALDAGVCMDLSGANASKYANIQIYTRNGSAAQMWRFTASDYIVMTSGEKDYVICETIVGRERYFLLPAAASVENCRVVRGMETFPLSECIDELNVMFSENVDAMFITSDDPILEGRAYIEASPEHTLKAKASMTLLKESGEMVYDNTITIKGRGNSTWDYDKKPYQIKLKKGTDLCETGDKSEAEKTWVLLADYLDPSLMRNEVAFELARELGIEGSVNYKAIDLYYDGEYRGTYLLCEKVEVGKGRVDISNLGDETEAMNPNIEYYPLAIGYNEYGNEFCYSEGAVNPGDITGGYLIEFDQGYAELESAWFTVRGGEGKLYFALKNPEYWTYDQANYMSCLMQEIMDCLENGTMNPRTGKKISDYIDMDSLARMFWVNEFAKNIDYMGWSSTYFFKDTGEVPMKCGPAWDFDVSMGSELAENRLTEGFLLTNNLFGRTLYKNYEAYSAIHKYYGEMMEKLAAYVSEGGGFDAAVEEKSASAEMNDLIWNRTGDEAMKPQTEELKEWMTRRINWLTEVVIPSESPTAYVSAYINGWYRIGSNQQGVIGNLSNMDPLRKLSANLVLPEGSGLSGSICYNACGRAGWCLTEEDVDSWAVDGEYIEPLGEVCQVRFALRGEIAVRYHIYYRVFADGFGWLGWAKDGEPAGIAASAGGIRAVQLLVLDREPSVREFGIASYHESPLMIRENVAAACAGHYRDVVEDGEYVIACAGSENMVLDVSGGAFYDGANVQIWSANGSAAQIWRVSHDGFGFVILQNVNSGKVLDAAGGSMAKHTNIQQYEFNGSWAQKWVVVPREDGFSIVASMSLRSAVDVYTGSYENGQNIAIYTDNDSLAQQFVFKKLVK